MQIPILPRETSGTFSNSSQRFIEALVLHKEPSARVASFQEYDGHQSLLKICLSLHHVPNPRLFTLEGIFKFHAFSPHLNLMQLGNVWQASESEGPVFKSWFCHLPAGKALSKWLTAVRMRCNYMCQALIWHTVCVLVSSGCHNRAPQTGELKQKSVFSRFWRSEVWGQGDGRQGWFLPRPLCFSCRWPSYPCVSTWSSLGTYVHVCVWVFFSCKNPSHNGLGLNLKILF